MKYFVLFKAECDGDCYRNDVISISKDIECYEDIKALEKLIERKWFDDDRELTLINFKKIKEEKDDMGVPSIS